MDLFSGKVAASALAGVLIGALIALSGCQGMGAALMPSQHQDMIATPGGTRPLGWQTLCRPGNEINIPPEDRAAWRKDCQN